MSDGVDTGAPPPVAVECDPPVSVLVDLDRWVIATPDDQMPGRVPLWLRREGWVLSGRVRGRLLGCLRSARGSWLAVCELRLTTGRGDRSITVGHLCPLRWVTRPDGTPVRAPESDWTTGWTTG